jgi:hypothetical protein
MAQTSLPAILESFRQAVNAGDTDAFLAFFPADGTVEDWGRRFSGHKAIRGWSDKELIGARGTLTYGPVIEETPDRISLSADWASSFFTGPGIFTFVFADGKIREMKISST